MALSKMPREIMLDIADELDNRGLSALARTTSELYCLLNGHLYLRDVIRTPSKSLTWAVENGVEDTIVTKTVQQLAAVSQHFNPIPESIHMALQDAANRGHVHLVEQLLKIDGINPNFVSHSQDAPLALAARSGHSAVVELLLAAVDIDPNVRDLQSDAIDAIDGADGADGTDGTDGTDTADATDATDAANATGATPLIHACRNGHVSIVRQLLARDDVDINAVGFDGEWRPVYPRPLNTPLTAACKGGHSEIANILLAREGIDVNLHKPLPHALNAGMVGVVESLLARGDLDTDTMGHLGHVLVRSVFQGHGIVKSLLDRYNIDPNVVRGDGVTALMNASLLGDVDIVKLLLDQEGIQVNQQDNSGMTALCWAAIRDHPEVAKALLDRDDINPNLPNNGFWESGHKSQSVVKLILEKGLPVRWNISLSVYDVYY